MAIISVKQEKELIDNNISEQDAGAFTNISLSEFVFILIVVTGILVITGSIAGIFSINYGEDLENNRILNRFFQLFNMNLEANIPSWYSGFLMIIISGLSFLIFKLDSAENKKYFFIISVMFLFMSMDEVASVHEILNNPVRNSLNLGGLFYWTWIIPGIIVVVLFALYFLRFLFLLEQKVRMLFLLSGFIYLFGAVCFEMIGGWLYSHNLGGSMLYVFEVVIEESLEMSGLLIFIYALVLFIKLKVKHLDVLIA
ncbi:Hypothetical protein IALB_2459 [Ignavibacterium album JCM 16511]|uniref:Uncharacterized protein n=1 Tax=Ignavibacterium album (strain DSM 19864 / JCM 16511 / NBRC 101810 / Mat9-16) TaxID=945713 RepID=I0AMF5_IGNAJ|nr:hypothetical protein [Ignavibacterium album]AFH50162.1 Hypothetical protein IALB_2459 [Ignavibacterium album JCM 16511]